MQRLTQKTIGVFKYELIEMEGKTDSFCNYDTFYAYKMAVKRLGELEDEQEAQHTLRILKNYIQMMPNAYVKRTHNWVAVRDLLMEGTRTAGMTSCIEKCKELGIDPYGYGVEDGE